VGKTVGEARAACRLGSISRLRWACRGVAIVLASSVLIAPMVLPAHGAEPIKIGAILALSGGGPVEQALEVKEGLDIAKEMVNRDGGPMGRPVEIIIEDNKNSVEVARTAAENLISQGVIALTGEHQSAIILSTIEVAHQRGLLYMNTNGWADEIRLKGYPEVFNPSNWNSNIAVPIIEVIKAFGGKQVVCIAQRGSNGTRLMEQIDRTLKKDKSPVAYRMETIQEVDSDLTPIIRPLKENPPDLVISICLPPVAYRLMRELYAVGVAPSKRTWMLDGGPVADFRGFGQSVGEAAKYMLVTGLYHPAMAMPPLGKAITEMYVAKYKKLPNRMIFQAVDSVLLIAEAVRRAGSTDTPALIRQLREMKYTGTRGTISFQQEPGLYHQQWLDVPYVTYQFTEAYQPIDQALLLQGPGRKLDPAAAIRPPR
jgi:branched-chain amino acid transport system substrate-binding protein